MALKKNGQLVKYDFIGNTFKQVKYEKPNIRKINPVQKEYLTKNYKFAEIPDYYDVFMKQFSTPQQPVMG